MAAAALPADRSPASPAPDATRADKGLLTAWLLLLLREGATYGYNLRRELQGRGIRTDPAAMYRMLRTCEEDGLVQSRWATSDEGPRRRMYRLTRKGRRALAELARVIAASRDVQDRFLSTLARSPETPPAA